MRSLFLFFTFFIIVLNVRAQDVRLEWVKGLFGTNVVQYDLSTDKQGNIYIVGLYSGTMDADPGPGLYLFGGNGLNGSFVIKCNSDGVLQWVRSFNGITGGSHTYAVTTDDSGNVIVSGYFDGTVDFDPGPGVYILDHALVGSVFTVKLDGNGGLLWVRTFRDGNNSRVQAGENGALYIGFTSTISNGSIDLNPGPGVEMATVNGPNTLLMCKLDAAGNYVWGKSASGLVDRTQYFSLDNNGHIYITGYFTGIQDFDPGPGVYNLASAYTCVNMYVSKWDTSGNFIWARSMGGQAGTQTQVLGRSVKVDVLGHVVIGGSFTGTADFDPGLGVSNLTSTYTLLWLGTDIHVTKLDESGNLLWAKGIGGKDADWITDLDIDSAGSIYSTGRFTDTVDFDPDTGIQLGIAHITSSWFHNSDVFIHKLNAAGAFEWVKVIGGDGIDEIAGIALDTAANIYLNGEHNHTIDFDPDTSEFYLTDTMWGYGGFILKMSDACATSGSAPSLSSAALTIICPDTTANLNNLVTSSRPANIVLQWFTNNTHTGTLYSTPTTATSGVYYAFYYDSVENCYSKPAAVTVSNGGMNTPVFDTIPPLCIGQTTSPLQTVSINNIAGAWAPAWDHTATTTYTFTPVVGQCAVPVTKTVIIKQITNSTMKVSICDGNSYLFNGQYYTTSNNTAKDTLINAAGCDSIISLDLTVVPVHPITINEQLEGCGSIRYNGQYYFNDTLIRDTLLSQQGCDSIYHISSITVYPQNPVVISIDTFACKTLMIDGVSYDKSTYVQDTLRTVNGCDSVIRHINIDIVNFDLDAAATINNPYEGEYVYIHTSSTNSQSYKIIKWLPEALFEDQVAYSNNFKASTPGTINVLVAAMGRHNCVDSVAIPVEVRPYDPKIMLPNAFTPNGDGRNDVFMPQLNVDRAFTFLGFDVYNRWGQVLYSTSNINAGWDGSYNGKLQEQGVYYYTIKVRLLNNDIRSFNGELTLLK